MTSLNCKMGGAERCRGAARRTVPIRLLVLGALLGVFLIARPEPVAAHAAYSRSEPAANAIVPMQPAVVRIWFTEPLEPAYTSARLYDGTGQARAGVASEVAADDAYQLVVRLPPGLANGTYTVAWRNLSAADGHGLEGYFAFTVGTAADVGQVVAVESGDPGSPDWLRTLSRWVALVGLVAAVAIWPIWVLVLRPALAAAGEIGEWGAVRAQWLTIYAVALAMGGNVFALFVQAAGSGEGDFITAIWTTLTETRYGRFWLIRIVLLAGFATALSWARWWPRAGRDVAGLAALVLAIAMPYPFSMVSHAAAQGDGRATAVAFDLVHLIAASLWIGGLYALAGVLFGALRRAGGDERRALLVEAIPRFSAVALVAWAAMIVTGLYNAWLQVGSLEALTETDYGTSLLAKLALLLPALGLGALNLLVVGPGLRRSEREERAGRSWAHRFTLAVGAEIVLTTLALIVVARLTSQEPGHEELATQAGRPLAITFDLTTGEETRASTLSVDPGAAGPNRYRLEVGGSPLPAGSEAVLRLVFSSVEIGTKEVKLTPAGENVFAGSGSELGITGDWTAEVIVRRLGEFEGRATLDLTLPAVAGQGGERVTSAWRFEWPGTVGLLFIVGGLIGLAAAWAMFRSADRFRVGLGGVAAIFLGAILLVGARMPSTEASLGARLAGTDAPGFATPVSAGGLTVALEPADLTVGVQALTALVRDANGQPVTDAEVTVQCTMPEMIMVPVVAAATPTGDGRYVASDLFFDEAAVWQVLVTVEPVGGEATTFEFAVEVA